MKCMRSGDGNWLAPVVLVLVVLTVDVFIFRDARARQSEGRAVVATLGPVNVSTPWQWLLGCLVLWVFVVPLYFVARDA
jgi:hypothetical protein